MNHMPGFTPAVLTLLLFAACAKPPTEHIESAEKAVRETHESGASAYVPQDFAKLEGMLAGAKKEIADQETKFSLLRDYGKAEQLAASVRAEAGRVKSAAEKRREEARAVALQAQQVAQESVKAAQTLVARAPVGKDRAALEAIKADAQALNASLGDVQKDIDAGDYLSAQAKAKAIHDKSQAVSAEIQNALAKVGDAKAKKVPSKKGE
ncbi:MAG: hypothetical protein ACT4OO_13500 [Nitrospiraceae bacterium]